MVVSKKVEISLLFCYNEIGDTMKKITIGLFNDSFPPMTDGVGMVVDNYARRLCKIANVVVCVPGYKGDYDDSILPYKVVRCKSMKMPFTDYSLSLPLVDKEFRKEVEKYDFDIIHIHSPFSIGKYGVELAKKRHIPVIGTMHSQYKQDFDRVLRGNKIVVNEALKEVIKVYDMCDRCYAVNSGMAHLYFDEYGVKEMPKVLPNATEMEYVEDKTKSCERINKLHGLKNDDKILLFVGRIYRLKNILFIVDSLKLLKEKKRNYSFKMLFVGHGQDEILLKDYIHKNKMDQDIILCGNVTDRELLRDYYVRSDLFLFPSIYDASSIVQIEAASQKVPTIFLKGSKTSSDIVNGVNGLLAESEKEFMECIDQMLVDKEKYQKISEGAYRDVYKNWDTVVKEVYQIYLDMIDRS